MCLYILAAEILPSGTYGNTTAPVYFNNVQCNGGESNLLQCNIFQIPAQCDHSRDVAIRCFRESGHEN